MSKRNTTKYSRSWRTKRKQAGLCRYCPAKCRPGLEACLSCAESKTQGVKHNYYANKSKGLCVGCAKPSKTTRCSSCRDKSNARKRQNRAALKHEVLLHYSSGPVPACYCCKETIIQFLTIDHINGGGNKHRATLGKRSGFIYVWLKEQGFPKGFRTACRNCNEGASLNKGVCPHKTRRPK